MLEGHPSSHTTVQVSTWSILKVFLVLLAFWFLWEVRIVVAMLFAASLLAALIEPLALWCARHRVPRALAVLLVYLGLLASAICVVFLLIPPLLSQVEQLVANLAVASAGVASFFGRFEAASSSIGLGENVRASLEGLQGQLANSVGGVFSTITGFVGGIAATLITFVLAFYLVVEGDAMKRLVRYVAPSEYQPFLSTLFSKMQKRIGAWLRAQIFLAIVVGALMYVGLRILGVPYALVLALASGFLEFIPYAGPLFATIPAVFVGLSLSPATGLLVLGWSILVQQIENNILVPNIMQRVTGLNPVVSIVALLVGIQLGGVLGAVLAIPAAAIASVILEELFPEPAT